MTMTNMSEYSEFYRRVIWIPTSVPEIQSFKQEGQFAAFIQHSSNGQGHLSMRPHSLEW